MLCTMQQCFRDHENEQCVMSRRSIILVVWEVNRLFLALPLAAIAEPMGGALS